MHVFAKLFREYALSVILAGGVSVAAYAQTGVSENPMPKAVLIEEQTGSSCGNCPDGAAMLTSLKESLGNRLQVVAYHVGHYAEPYGSRPDFRTWQGDSLLSFWGEYGYPSASIERRYFEKFGRGILAFGRGNWEEAIGMCSADTATVNLYVSATLDATVRELKVNVEGYYFKASDSVNNYLHVALIQNHLEGPQNQAPADYLHEHVFRDCLTPIWGDTLRQTSRGSRFSRTYTYTVPENYRGVEADVRNMEVVIFVSEGCENVINAAGCKPRLSGINDPAAAVLRMKGISQRYVARDFAAEIQSKYNDTVKRIGYEVTLNGEKKTYEMDVCLPPYETENVTLRVDAYEPAAQNTIVFRLVSLNGTAYNGNGVSLTFSAPLSVVSPLIVELSTDADPQEVFWYVADPDGTHLYDFGPYTGEEQVSVTEGLKLEEGYWCIHFCDAKGNGWQNKPRGSYKIKDAEGKLVAQNYDVRDKGEIVSVHVSRKGTPNEISSAFEQGRLYPNPTSGNACFSGTSCETGIWHCTLSDLRGEVLYSGTLAVHSGEDFELSLSLGQLPEGLYLFHVKTLQGIRVFKLVKR